MLSSSRTHFWSVPRSSEVTKLWVWSISVFSVCRLRSPSRVLNTSQMLFQSVFPALQRDACHHRVCMPDVCWQFYPFHVPASAGCGIKSISYTKDTDREKGSDLCESIHKVCSKVGKKIPPWLFTLASRGALQEWAATCSSAQDLSSALKLVWRIYFGLDLLSPREMHSCWQLECTWCTSFGLIQPSKSPVCLLWDYSWYEPTGLLLYLSDLLLAHSPGWS